MTARRLAVVIPLLLLALPGAAHAGTASISGSQIVVNAGQNEANELWISDQGSDVRIYEDGFFVSIGAGTGCVSGGFDIVLCPRAGITSITVSAGDRADAVVTSSTLPATINAGTGDDEIIGGPGDDTINGDADDDAMDGGLGSDALNGGSDTLDPYGNGGDWVSYEYRSTDVTADLDGDGGDGQASEDDTIGSDIEHLAGGTGDDTLTGNGGQNAFIGGGGADLIRGGGGTDWAVYWDKSTATTISLDGIANDGSAGEGDNLESGIENIIGGSGPDTLTGDGAANGFYGQSGNDVMDGRGGADVLDGSSGIDTATYASRTAAVTADPDEVADDGEQGEGDNVDDDVETLVGGAGGDTLTGSSVNNTLEGGEGDDTLDGAAGTDVLVGDGGSDTVTYASRTAPVTADPDGAADDGTQGENDTIATDVESLLGGEAGDTLTGNDADNLLDGGPGADVLNGGGGVDTVTYESRTTPVTANLDGSAGDGEQGENDTVGTDVESLMGGAAADTLTGSEGANTLTGGDGDDVLDASVGTDTFDGGAGNDTLRARDGVIDSLRCGAGSDSPETDPDDEVASDCDVQPSADPAEATGAAVKIGVRKVRVNKRGVAIVPLRCTLLDGICKGTVTLTAKRAKKTKKGKAQSSRRSRPRRAVIGRASFKADAGETVKVKVKLSHNGRRRVLRNRKLRCRASVKTVAEDGTQNVVEKSLTLLGPKKEDGR